MLGLKKIIIGFLLLITFYGFGYCQHSSSTSTEKDTVTAGNWVKLAKKAYTELGQIDTLYKYLKLAANIYQKNEIWDQYASCLSDLGTYWYEVGNYEQFLAFTDSALKICESHNLTKSLAIPNCLKNLGVYYTFQEGKAPYAIVLLDSALKMETRLAPQNIEALATTHLSLTSAHFVSNNFFQARAHAEKSKNLWLDHCQHKCLAYYIALNNYGSISFRLGDLEVARLALEEFLNGIDNLQNLLVVRPQEFVNGYNNLGTIYYDFGDYANAKILYDKALQLYNKSQLNIPHLKVKILDNLIDLYTNSEKDLSLARSYALDASELIEQSKVTDPEIRGVHFIYQGLLEQKAGQWKKALISFAEAQSIFQKNDHLWFQQVTVASHIATSYIELGDTAAALRYAKERVQILPQKLPADNPRVADGFSFLGRTFLAFGEIDSALINFNLALASLCPESSVQNNAWFLPPLIEVSQKTKLLEVLQGKSKILQILLNEQSTDSTLYEDLLLAHYRSMVDLISHMRASFNKESQQTFLTNAYYHVFENGLSQAYIMFQKTQEIQYLEDFFYFLEKAKSSLLIAGIRFTELEHYPNEAGELISQIQRIRLRNNYYEPLLYEAQLNKNSKVNTQAIIDSLSWYREQESILKRRLQAEFPDYFTFLFGDRVVSLETFQQQLHSYGECWFSYFWGSDHLFMMVANGDQIVIEQIPLDQIETDLQQLKRKLATGNFPDSFDGLYQQYSLPSFQLFDQLILPYKSFWECRSIVVSPHGKINHFPFGSLIMRKPQMDQDFSDLQFWGLLNPIRYAYSATVEQELRLRKLNTGPNEVLALAPVNFQGPDSVTIALGESFIWEALPSSALEIEAIQRFFSGKALLEEMATKENFLTYLPDYNMIHLATHAWIDSSLVNRSGFLLNRPDSIPMEEAILDIHAIYGLPLRGTKLIVLSACYSGMGQIERGEGSLNLGRAFMYAGASSVLSSLWQAKDESTKEIMTYFYQYLEAGESKDVALQKARIDFVSRHPEANPHLWANFVVVGDPTPLASPPSYFLIGVISLALLLLCFLSYRVYRTPKIQSR